MTAVRRSGRERRQAENFYEDAKEEIESHRSSLASASIAAASAVTPASSSVGDSVGGASSSSVEKSKKGRSKGSSTKKKNAAQEEKEEDESETEEEAPGTANAADIFDSSEEEEGDVDDDSDSDDEDFQTKPSKKKKTKTKPSKKPPARPDNKNKVQVLLKPLSSSATAAGFGAKQRGGARKGKKVDSARRALNVALANLSRKVLDPSETTDEYSLVAGLLTSYKTTASSKNPFTTAASATDSSYASHPRTVYTPQLETLASSVIQLHNSDPNRAQIHLLNLLFRSVGGTVETNLDPEEEDEDGLPEISLEDMDNETWARIVTDLVDEMRHTPADRILLCADPNGAVHAAAAMENSEEAVAGEAGDGKVKEIPVTNASLGVREYRKIYEEFWYVLGCAALTEGSMSNNAKEEHEEIEDSSDEEEDSEEEEEGPKRKKSKKSTPSKKRKSKGKKKQSKDPTYTTTIRFDAELVRDLMTRVSELVSVGQPDVRAAATIAAMSMGHAVLDKTNVLGAKLDVATRQLAAAVKASTSSKSPGKKGGKKGTIADTSSSSRKAESLRHQVDSLKRTRADLEEVVLGPLIQGVFIHRYRDSNPYIRSFSLTSFSHMTIQRSDIFLQDKYLKYFGWMMSDKSDVVRVASVKALVSPFEAVKKSSESGNNNSGGGSARHFVVSDKIDVSMMEHVVAKFLPRIADCAIDVSNKVQEVAMKLLLSLLRDGFLDDVEDESWWNQINMRALARDATPNVRRDALYFVMEQLEAFDEGADEDEEEEEEENEDEDDEEDDDDAPKNISAGKSRSTSTVDAAERRAAQRLDALASWAAHILTDGPVPIDKIQVDLADYIVHSVRSMPEHQSIVTNWSAMLRAIGEDNVATTAQGTAAGERADVAKQRVLVRMLATAARAEVGDVADSSFLLRDVDADVVHATGGIPGGSSNKGKKASGKGRVSTGLQHESLSVALLRALPDLLIKFKSDAAVLESISSLPRYLIPTVFSLPQRKKDFTSLNKNLSEIYLQSTDENVLRNVALSLAYLSRGDHARAPEARLQLQKVTQQLRDRVVDMLLSEDADHSGTKKRKRGKGKAKGTPASKKRRSENKSASSNASSLSDESDDDDDDTEIGSKEADIEYTLSFNLKRLRVLSKRCDISEFFDDSGDDNELEDLCSAVTDGLARRLKMRKSASGEDGQTDTKIWKSGDKRVHTIVADGVSEGLMFLLSIVAWKLHTLEEQEGLVVKDDEDIIEEAPEDDDDDEVHDHIVLRLRNRLIALTELCFEQFLPNIINEEDEETEIPYTAEQIAFADAVQFSAGQVAADLRTLFPKEWANAASPLLRAFSLAEDGRLIGGYIRFFRSKEDKIRLNEELDEEDREPVNLLLLPLARSLATNWSNGNRREAGVALAHVTGSGQEAQSLITTMSRVLKKTEPVRLLEAHMASLRQSYDEWMDNEPEEMESDCPTDAEMAAFEEAEEKHKEQFDSLEHQALRFSTSLGVSKLSDPKLSPALLGFLREGTRYAFSNDEGDVDDELILGSRLSFLSILSKYGNWVKKGRANQKEILQRDLDQREAELRSNPDFEEVHEDDLAALEKFRLAVGLKPFNGASMSVADTADQSVGEDDEGSDAVSDLNVTPSPSTMKSTTIGRLSRGSSVTSIRSRLSSAQGSLPPLYEEDATAIDSGSSPASPSTQASGKSSKRGTDGMSQSTYIGKTQATINDGTGSEGSMEDESTDSNLFESRSKSSSKKTESAGK